MKRILILFFFCLSVTFLNAQDLFVISVTNPTDGCSLSSSEKISVYIGNSKKSDFIIGSTYTVSYTINSGNTITQSGVNFINSTANNLQFITPADLSTYGTYTIDIFINLPGDTDPSNNLVSVTVINDEPVVLGEIIGDSSVCAFDNSGSIELQNYNYNIENWEFSEDDQNTWVSTGVNSVEYNFTNLQNTTFYRAILSSEYGYCDTDTSNVPFKVAVSDTTFTGYVSKDTTVCEYFNNGNLQLVNSIGNVNYWEYSNDLTNWVRYESTLKKYPFDSLYQDTYVRASIQNGSLCKQLNSEPVLITMYPKPVVNSISNDTTVCSYYNNGSINLNDFTGQVSNWSYSIDNGITWVDTLVNSSSISYTSLTDTTIFKPFLFNDFCSKVSEVEVVVFSNDTTDAGFLDGFNQFCDIALTGQFTLLDYTGAVLKWEKSTDGNSWNAIPGTSDVTNFSNVSNNEFYRVAVQSGVCNVKYTPVRELNIYEPTVAGTLLVGDTAYCINNLNDSIGVQTNIGDVYYWLYSDDGITWESAYSSSNFFYLDDLVSSIDLKAVFRNGTCNEDTSEVISVDLLNLPNVDAGLDFTVLTGGVSYMNGSGDGVALWQPSTGLVDSTSFTTEVLPLESIYYKLYVTDLNGCVNYDSVFVDLELDTPIFNLISNVITPNGDGKNDNWFIDGIEKYSDSHVVIFDQYGSVVYETDNYMNDWDATFNGSYLPNGTYFYYLTFKENNEFVYKGSITIVSE